jgi:HD-GYP domain-containing protein (c-di-GMP phosphodiesterase class II)
VVEEAGAKLGLPAPERRDARLAAHLHDLGQVAVATSIWTRPRLLRPTELERARSHVYFTERILASAPPLVSVARIAGAHHERLDGSGYHRGQKQSAIPRTARLLAAADAMCGMQEERPHRPAKSREAAAMELRGMAKGGLLDPDCVDAVLATFGERRASSASPAPSLTARETDVLKLLAVGKTNKEIAQSLGISDRTVQHHTVHIYGKLGVNTRAAAALLAARYGVLDVASDLA